MAEFSYRYYKRYLKLKLEKTTLEQELSILKTKQDKLAYSGCRDVKAVNYEKEIISNSNTQDINKYYQQFVDLSLEIRSVEQTIEKLENIIKSMENTFKTYSKECNDIEMKIFIEMYVHNKRLCDITIPKPNSPEFYSIRQMNRFHKNLKRKLEQI